MAAATTTSPTSTRSYIGPLTTTYTAPQVCFNFAQDFADPVAWAGQACWGAANVVDAASCWPPALVSTPRPPFEGWGFYSPGLICPSGYTSACTTALEESGSPPSFSQEFNFQFQLIPGETAVGCCPTSFKCNKLENGAQTCVSYLTSGSYLAGICQSSLDTLTDFQYFSVPAINAITFAVPVGTFTSSVIEITATDTATLYAPLIQINWQSNDLSTSKTSSISSTVPAPSLTSSILTSSSSVVTSSPSGLSTGVIAAIAVVVPVLILAFIGLILCWWFRRRRRYRAPAECRPIQISGDSPTGFPLVPTTGGNKYVRFGELDPITQQEELGTERQGMVNSGYTPFPHELDASRL